ncbi:MAG: enoyl-CoA hydratase-related protein [Pseudomonadota bacterium]
MSYNTISLDVADGVATVTIMRPDAANALSGEVIDELWQASIICDDDPAIRAVILTATGRMFCGGGDLKDFCAQGDDMPAYLTRGATKLHAAVTRFQRMDAPLIVAVNGVAGGGGLSLVTAGDVVLAAESSSFVSAYTASGLTPDGSSTYFLAKHIGLMRAKEMVFLNRKLSAEEALDWGLVTRVVPDDALMDQAREMAAAFAVGPTKAYGGAKKLMLTAFSNTLETQVELETVSIANQVRGHDGRHGIESFAAREKPVFKGE